MPDHTPVQLWLAQLPPEVMLHAPSMVFVFCLGACVGSFVNVVVYRLPSGMSVISPPSRCPTCGAGLRFFRENLPILGWFVIRGRCRYCGVRVSPQYMVVELLMALIFLGLYAVLFLTSRNTPWWGQVGGVWWTTNTFLRAWPVYLAIAFLMAGLVAMTLIDARTFTIPIQIPVFVTATAFIAYPLQALMPHRSPLLQSWPIPGTDWTWTCVAAGGMLGLAISWALLRSGRIRYSFADYEDYVAEGETLGDYPHARREMVVEILYLLPCLVGIAAGFLIGSRIGSAPPPHLVQAIGATFIGYIVGGGLIWGTRILGTLAFGREAMGLGDVHLLAAVGAVVGWFDPILIFFIAPFSGLSWVFVSIGLASMFKRARRELPYGPHLAVATLVMLLCRPGLPYVWPAHLPIPGGGFVQPSPSPAGGGMLRPLGSPRRQAAAEGPSRPVACG